jgi:hypothetical protein
MWTNMLDYYISDFDYGVILYLTLFCRCRLVFPLERALIRSVHRQALTHQVRPLPGLYRNVSFPMKLFYVMLYALTSGMGPVPGTGRGRGTSGVIGGEPDPDFLPMPGPGGPYDNTFM